MCTRPGFNLEYNQQHKLYKSLIFDIRLFDVGRGNLSYYKEWFRSTSLMHTTRVSEAISGHTSCVCVCMYTCACTCVCMCVCCSRYHYPSLHLLRHFKSLHEGPQQGQGTISEVGPLATSRLESLLKPVHLKFTRLSRVHSSLNSWPRGISFPLVSKHAVGTNSFHTSLHCTGIRSGETFPPGLDVFIQMPYSENSPSQLCQDPTLAFPSGNVNNLAFASTSLQKEIEMLGNHLVLFASRLYPQHKRFTGMVNRKGP